MAIKQFISRALLDFDFEKVFPELQKASRKSDHFRALVVDTAGQFRFACMLSRQITLRCVPVMVLNLFRWACFQTKIDEVKFSKAAYNAHVYSALVLYYDFVDSS